MGNAGEEEVLKKKWFKRGLLLAALMVGGVLFFRWSQESIVTPVYTVTSPDLPEVFDGFRIVHISDLHGKEFETGNRDLLRQVAQLQPDLIAVTGDLIDRESQLQMVPALARGLGAIAPACYVVRCIVILIPCRECLWSGQLNLAVIR